MAAAEFAVRLLKALFLVKYVKEFKPTLRNLSVLMLDRFDQDIPALRKKIEAALNLLEQQTYIQRNGELYEYRPGRSAHDALAVARQRCWRHDWVVDLDIKGFFDNIDWGLLMRALRRHTECKWVLKYVERWLQAPVCMPDGTLMSREKGTPQGGVVSPILSNLFLHYVFDC